MTALTTPRKRRKIRIATWGILILFLAIVGWALASNNPFAQGIRQALGSPPDQIVLDKSFAVSPHSFRYYTFSLPSDAKNVVAVGYFTVSTASNNAGDHPNQSAPQSSTFNADIEAVLLDEASLTAWEKGSVPHSIYESGRVSQGWLRHELPSGPGVYYLVFSNKFDSQSAKSVKAVIQLHFRSWFPEWLRRSNNR